MATRHGIDLSLQFKAALPQRRTRQIEVANVDTIRTPISDPPRTEQRDREEYKASPALENAVNLAIALGRPLLLQGDPGSGKTRLAYAVAYALGLPLERAYIKSTSRAQDLLYTYDAVARLYDSQLATIDPPQAARSLDANNYIRFGPLGRAIIRAGEPHLRRSVVLIDEIDKADLDFPNDLLRELDELEFEIADAPGEPFSVPKDRLDLRPIIFVTHNEEKALPGAFLRRCIYHFVEFPEKRADLDRILRLHGIGSPALRAKAIDVVTKVRALDLSRKPGLSELLDWVSFLQEAKIEPTDVPALPHLDALVKNPEDQRRVTTKKA